MLVTETGKDFSVQACLKRDVSDEPSEKSGRAGAPRAPGGAGLAHAGRTSRWRKIRIQLALRNRVITKSDLDGNIVQPAGREATIEVPHSGDDHPDNGHPDVGPGLVQHDEIETLLLDELDAGDHLRSVVEMAEIGPGGGRDPSIVAWQEVGMLVQPPRARAVGAGALRIAACHQTDRKELIELRDGPQRCNAGIKVCTGAEFEVFLRIL